MRPDELRLPPQPQQMIAFFRGLAEGPEVPIQQGSLRLEPLRRIGGPDQGVDAGDRFLHQKNQASVDFLELRDGRVAFADRVHSG